MSRTNYPALGIVPTGEDELSIYLQKNYGQPTSHLQRFTLRTDGFASVHAGYDKGEMATRPLRFSKKDNVRLLLNYSTSSAGSTLVELQDEEGQPIPGYALDDCLPSIGDRISGAVAWKSGRMLEDLADKAIRVRFVLKDADLYAMQFDSLGAN